MSFIREDGNSLISIFMIDRLAIGYGYELIKSEFKEKFNITLTKELYDSYKSKYASDIELRRDAIRALIYDTGAYSKLISISDKLYQIIQSGDDPKEISTVAATLRGYLDSMSKMGVHNEKTVIKQQNNFVILKELEKEGVIKINDEKRLKYLADGVESND